MGTDNYAHLGRIAQKQHVIFMKLGHCSKQHKGHWFALTKKKDSFAVFGWRSP